MQPDKDGWYSHLLDNQEDAYFLFNDGGNIQTEDYYFDQQEAWYSEEYLWNIPPDYYSHFTFPNGLKKALVMSFDDGTTQDEQLIALFNRYGIKGTFHVNSGLMHDPGKISEKSAFEIYQGHEVSLHSSTHPFLYDATDEHIRMEIYRDQKKLEAIFKTPMRGMSYPYGSYNLTMLKRMREWGIIYGRVVPETNNFHLPGDLLRWRPSCHHSQAQELTSQFLDFQATDMALFLIWGHSWEFDGNQDNNSWEYIESVCKQLSRQDDIWYATMIEIADYLYALRSLTFSDDGRTIYNPTQQTVWVKDNCGNGTPLESNKKIINQWGGRVKDNIQEALKKPSHRSGLQAGSQLRHEFTDMSGPDKHS